MDDLIKKINNVIQVDATDINYRYFLATHTPFNNLGYTEGGKDERVVRLPEEEFFLEKFWPIRNEHNFIVVQGEHGSGKSHFIKWVKERYVKSNNFDEEKEAVLLIRREQCTLKRTLQQIIEADIFPESFNKDQLDNIIRANEQLDDRTLKKQIIAQCSIIASNSYETDDFEILDQNYLNSLHAFLSDEIIQEELFKENGPIERIKSKLNAGDNNVRQDDKEAKFYPDDFLIDYNIRQKMKNEEANKKAIQLADDLDIFENVRDDVAEFLNSKMQFIVENCINLRASDLQLVFEKLRIELKKVGKSLTLFIEDIAAFPGIDNALMEVLIKRHDGAESNKKFCRLSSFVGVTNAYYETSLPGNIKDRITGRVITDNSIFNESKEDKLCEMAARYINTINLNDQNLDDWIKNSDAKIEDLPIAEENIIKYEWANYQLDDGKVMSLYPFNKNAIRTLFNCLEEDKKTPRDFLRFVVKRVLIMYARNKSEFPPSVRSFEIHFDLPAWKNALHGQLLRRRALEVGEDSKRLTSLIKIWGNNSLFVEGEKENKRVGGLSRKIYDDFGLEFIQGVNSEDDEEHETNNGEEREPEYTSTTEDQEATSSRVNVNDENRKLFSDMQKEIEAWAERNEKLRLYSDLRDDIKDILIDFIDWKSEGIPGDLVETIINKKRVSIEDQNGKFYPGFQVKRSEDSRYALLALAAWRYLGEQSWDFQESASHLTNLHRWLTQVQDEVIKAVKAPANQDVEEWDMPKWAILAEFYCQVLAGNISLSNRSVKDIYNNMVTKQPIINIEEDHSTAWISLQKILSRQGVPKSINANHNFIKNYYNQVQGKITNNTNVYIFDVVEIWDVLNELKKLDWDIKQIDIPVIDDDLNQHKDNIYYRTLYLIKNKLEGNIDKALTEEKNRMKMIKDQVLNYVDGDSDNDFKDLFQCIDSLINNPEDLHYSNRFIIQIQNDSVNYNWNTVLKNYKRLNKALVSKTRHEKIIRYSQNPGRIINNFLKNLEKINISIEQEKESALNTIQILKNKSEEVDTIIEKTKSEFFSLNKVLKECNKGDADVSSED